MSEIKFRGKRTDNGEWVHGYYFKHMDKHKIHVLDGVVSEVYSVDPETVGQYTEFKDKNGVETYKGDVLRRDGFWPMIVEKYRVYPLDKIQRLNSNGIPIDKFEFDSWSVTGNIHNNKELLEG